MVAIKDLSGSLGRSSYTCQWLIEKLSKGDKVFKERSKKAHIEKVTFCEIGEGGLMSSIYKVRVHFEDESKPHTVIFKLPQPESINDMLKSIKAVDGNERTDEEDIDASSMHEREVQFYRKFATMDDLPLPKIFAAETYIRRQRDGTILMEDLSEKAALCNYMESLNIRKIINITNMIAKLVTVSLTKLTQSDLQQYQIQMPLLKSFVPVQKSAAERTVKAHPELFTEIMEMLKNVIGSSDYLYYSVAGVNQDLGIPAVLVHSDLHNNNIFWKAKRDGSCSDEIYAIIDWQTTFRGSIGHDLSGFMILAVDEELRRKCEVWLFDYFHAIVKAELQSKGFRMPFTVEQIKASYRGTFIKNALFFLICGPTVVSKGGSKRRDEEACCRRLKCALEDSLKILQQDLPQFL